MDMARYKILLVSGLILISACAEKPVETNSGSENVEEYANEVILPKARFGKELIEAFVPFVSPSVMSNGKVHFSYELQVANTYRLPMELTKVEVYDVDNQEAPIASFDSIYISANLQRPGLSTDQNDKLFNGGQFGIVNLWVSVLENEKPDKIFHKLYFKVQTGNGQKAVLAVDKAMISFPEITQLALSPPFREGYWFYLTVSHKNTRELTEGKPSYAQRFAFDWAAVDREGAFHDGDRSENESFFSYGKEILAVADGIVVSVKDSIPENQGETEERAIKIDRYNSSGNHVVLDIGNGVNVLYAHLIPNRIKVKVGSKVKAGDVLGFLGNSGESSGPHLHMHLETRHKLLLGGEGLPFHFKEYTEVSVFDKNIDVDSLFSKSRLPMDNLNALKRNELPIGIGVLAF